MRNNELSCFEYSESQTHLTDLWSGESYPIIKNELKDGAEQILIDLSQGKTPAIPHRVWINQLYKRIYERQ